MKQIILILTLLAITISVLPCNAQAPKNGYTITGNLTGLKAHYIYFRGQKGDFKDIDSAITKDGKFTFTGNTPEPRYAEIYINTHILGIYFYVQNAAINITGNADSLDKVKITGPATQDESIAFDASMKYLTGQFHLAEKNREEAEKKKDTATAMRFNAQLINLHEQVLERNKAYIIAHPKSFLDPSLLASLRYHLKYEDLDSLFNCMDTSVQRTWAAKNFYGQFLGPMSNTAIGKPVILFTQNNMKGRPVSLANYKGKYVLLDFWASWCGPCRVENPNVLKAFNKYKNKGFTVLGVSLDDNRDKWKKAVVQDKLTWEQVSDLKQWKNEAAQKYNVYSLPSNFLIDPNGIIIGHDLYGDDLSNKLAEVIK